MNIVSSYLTFFQLCFILYQVHRRVEQLAARRAHNPEVVGSSPTPAKFEKASLFKDAFFLIREILLKVLPWKSFLVD